MFPDNISQNIDILVVINVWKKNFGFHSNQKTQGQKHRVNNLYFKYQVCQMKLRHLTTFLQFRLLFHEPHCSLWEKFCETFLLYNNWNEWNHTLPWCYGIGINHWRKSYVSHGIRRSPIEMKKKKRWPFSFLAAKRGGGPGVIVWTRKMISKY